MTTDDLKMRIPRICSNAAPRGGAPFRRRPGRDSALRTGLGHRRPLTFRRREGAAPEPPFGTGGVPGADGAAAETRFRTVSRARKTAGLSAARRRGSGTRIAGYSAARRRGVSRSADDGMYNTAAADFSAARGPDVVPGIAAGAGGRPVLPDNGQERETLRELRRIASLLNGLKPVLREDRRLELE